MNKIFSLLSKRREKRREEQKERSLKRFLVNSSEKEKIFVIRDIRSDGREIVTSIYLN
jgi:hypothetical protein